MHSPIEENTDENEKKSKIKQKDEKWRKKKHKN
jgi:hypothetical protein